MKKNIAIFIGIILITLITAFVIKKANVQKDPYLKGTATQVQGYVDDNNPGE